MLRKPMMIAAAAALVLALGACSSAGGSSSASDGGSTAASASSSAASSAGSASAASPREYSDLPFKTYLNVPAADLRVIYASPTMGGGGRQAQSARFEGGKTTAVYDFETVASPSASLNSILDDVADTIAERDGGMLSGMKSPRSISVDTSSTETVNGWDMLRFEGSISDSQRTDAFVGYLVINEGVASWFIVADDTGAQDATSTELGSWAEKIASTYDFEEI